MSLTWRADPPRLDIGNATGFEYLILWAIDREPAHLVLVRAGHRYPGVTHWIATVSAATVSGSFSWVYDENGEWTRNGVSWPFPTAEEAFQTVIETDEIVEVYL